MLHAPHCIYPQIKDSLQLPLEIIPSKLYPTLKMDVMSAHILSKAGLEREHCYQYAGEYASDYKMTRLKRWLACRDALLHHVHPQSGMKFSSLCDTKVYTNLKCNHGAMQAITIL